MPAQINIVDAVTPEYLAIQAPPDVVEFAERVHQAFLESLQSRLTAALGVETRASFDRTEQSSMARYLTDTEPGTHNVVLSLDPLPGCAVLRFSSELLFKVLDILLAGPATAAGPRAQSLTEIEFLLLHHFFQVFTEVLKGTWRSIPPNALNLSPEGGEERLPGHDDLHSLVMRSTLEIDGAGGDFYVVIPSFLARLSARLPGLQPDEAIPGSPGARSTSARITQGLASAKVDLDAVLSNLTIRIGDLLELVPGQIVLAEKTSDSTFECLVNRRSQFRGELVAAEDRYGFQLARESAGDEEAASPADR